MSKKVSRTELRVTRLEKSERESSWISLRSTAIIDQLYEIPWENSFLLSVMIKMNAYFEEHAFSTLTQLIRLYNHFYNFKRISGYPC